MKLQSESMVMQVMLTGMMEELKKVEGGEEILDRVFDYTSDDVCNTAEPHNKHLHLGSRYD